MMGEIEGKMGQILVGDQYPVRIVGIVNLSQASFYKSSISSIDEITKKIELMVNEGADCIDIGAQSTRPIQIYGGEGRIDEEAEREIITKAVKNITDLKESYDVEFSIDTVRSSVAEVALNSGLRIINDISGLKKDEKMAELIAEYDASVIVMAAKKEPGDVYTIEGIIEELKKSIELGVRNSIDERKIIVDPGIGSWEARPFKHDFIIINKLKDFRVLKKPIYVGISRKTFIGKVLGNAPPEERLYGSLGATSIAIWNGAHIVRTHDVKATLEAVRVVEALMLKGIK